MKAPWSKAVGVGLMIGAVMGLVIGVAGLTLVWWGTNTLTDKVLEATESADHALTATDDLLVVIDETLGRTESRLVDIETAVDNVAAALTDTADSARLFGALASGDVTSVIAETRTALASVATTARLVDRGLTVVSNVPFVESDYRPEVSLSESIAGVSDALEPVPDQLAQIDDELQKAANNIEVIRDDIVVLTDNLEGVETSLRQTAAVAAAYRDTVADVQDGVTFLEDNIEPTMRFVKLLAVALFVWLLIAQLGMFTQGWDRWRTRDELDEQRP